MSANERSPLCLVRGLDGHFVAEHDGSSAQFLRLLVPSKVVLLGRSGVLTGPGYVVDLVIVPEESLLLEIQIIAGGYFGEVGVSEDL